MPNWEPYRQHIWPTDLGNFKPVRSLSCAFPQHIVRERVRSYCAHSAVYCAEIPHNRCISAAQCAEIPNDRCIAAAHRAIAAAHRAIATAYRAEFRKVRFWNLYLYDFGIFYWGSFQNAHIWTRMGTRTKKGGICKIKIWKSKKKSYLGAKFYACHIGEKWGNLYS